MVQKDFVKLNICVWYEHNLFKRSWEYEHMEQKTIIIQDIF